MYVCDMSDSVRFKIRSFFFAVGCECVRCFIIPKDLSKGRQLSV